MPHPAVTPSGSPRPFALVLGGLLLASCLTGCGACDRFRGWWHGVGCTIMGTVSNASGAPIPGATVTLLHNTHIIGTGTKTTDENGRYVFSLLDPGIYSLRVTAPGYAPYESSTTLVLGDTWDHNVTLTGGNEVRGQVTNAQDGQAVGNVPVTFRRGSDPEFTVQAGADGTFIAAGVAEGTYQVCVSHPGFVRFCRSGVWIAGNGVVTLAPLALVVPPAAGTLRAVVTWGEQPVDLDAHLTGPDPARGRFHVYFSRRGAGNATLDHDDTDGRGPETVTIPLSSAGAYRFTVFNYSDQSAAGAQGLAASPALVEVYGPAGLIKSYTAPSAGSGNTWQVFEVTLSGGQPTFNDDGGRSLGYGTAGGSSDVGMFTPGTGPGGAF